MVAAESGCLVDGKGGVVNSGEWRVARSGDQVERRYRHTDRRGGKRVASSGVRWSVREKLRFARQQGWDTEAISGWNAQIQKM